MKDIFVDAIDSVSTTQLNELGIKRIDNEHNKAYRYYQLSDSATTSAGVGTVVYASSTAGVVTDDISTSHPNFVKGVGITTVPVSYFAWFQVEGDSTVKTDGGDDIAKGDALIGDPSTDGVCDSVAAGTAPTHKVLGWATAADSDANNTVAADLVIG